MKTALVWVLALAILSHSANAQQPEKSFSISLTGGFAFPIGEFGKKTFSQDPDSAFGLAKAGPTASLKFAYRLKPTIALVLLANGGLFKQDENAFIEDENTIVDVHKWEILDFMAGTEFFLPLGSKEKGLEFTYGFFAGMLKTHLPSFRVVQVDIGGTSAYWRDRMDLKWTFCFQTEIGLQYQLSKTFYLKSNLAYMSSSKMESADYDNYWQSWKFTTISIQAGAGLRF